jgi:hypothetical protein
VIPSRTLRELAKLRNFAIFASFFRRRDLRSLELRLRDVVAKGCLDLELVYRWRQKKSLLTVKQKIVKKIQQNESAYSFKESVLSVLTEGF